MKRHVEEIIDDFVENDRVVVFSENHLYNVKYGNIIRLGQAGEITYYHVRIDGFNTPMTFMRRQVQKA